MSLAAPTIYDHASDELKSKYLRQTLTGELTWCQLFSEPRGLRSCRLAVHRTKMERGDQWPEGVEHDGP